MSIGFNPSIKLLAAMARNDEGLRLRGLSLTSFNAFLDYLGTTNIMTGMLIDVTELAKSNFTAIDAVALINNIGIRVFDRHGRLIHQFIPPAATCIKYLFHDALHFQLLYPVDDEMDVDDTTT